MKRVRGTSSNSSVADVKRLDEPEIYANRLLGIRINTTEKIVMRKKDG